jgi:response regulator of citrate/malate metabolism
LIQHFLRSLSEKYRKENTDNRQIESIISEKNVDILLLEVLSQNASEIEMIKTVRNRCPDTEIILIDGDADRDLIATAFSYGIRDAFRKPYNRVLIVERVYALLRRLRRAKHAIED